MNIVSYIIYYKDYFYKYKLNHFIYYIIIWYIYI